MAMRIIVMGSSASTRAPAAANGAPSDCRRRLMFEPNSADPSRSFPCAANPPCRHRKALSLASPSQPPSFLQDRGVRRDFHDLVGCVQHLPVPLPGGVARKGPASERPRIFVAHEVDRGLRRRRQQERIESDALAPGRPAWRSRQATGAVRYHRRRSAPASASPSRGPGNGILWAETGGRFQPQNAGERPEFGSQTATRLTNRPELRGFLPARKPRRFACTVWWGMQESN